MTLEEVSIALKFGFDVTIEPQYTEFEQGKYRITNLCKSRNRLDKNYSYSVDLTQNGRVHYHLPINKLLPDPDMASTYETLVKDFTRDNLKYSLKAYINDGMKKTKLVELVKTLIDEINKK